MALDFAKLKFLLLGHKTLNILNIGLLNTIK